MATLRLNMKSTNHENLIFIWWGKLSAMFSLYFKDLSYNHAFKFK